MPAPPKICIAQSITWQAIDGATTLIIAISAFAPLLPATSIIQAALSVSRRAWSIMQRACAMRSRVTPCSASGRWKATRLMARLHISSSERSARPIRRMQWWMRPGPRRPCAISKPRPSPSRMFETGTRTFSNSTSMWPCGASSKPNTFSGRSTLTPGVSAGTSTIDCCACLGADGSVLPMKM